MIGDIKDATLEATAEMQEIMREVMEEAILPQMKLAARIKWAKMPAEERERFKQERPEEYRAFMESAKGK